MSRGVFKLENKKTGESEEYVQAVVLINTKHHEDGTPALCTFIRDDQKIDLAGGEEFMIVLAPKKMVMP